MHYFDYAATTPLHPKAANMYNKIAQTCYGNTTSLHEIGTEADNIVTYCRNQFAENLGVNPAGIYFTSGGTESNLLSIISLAKANQVKGKHIITTLGEHPSVDSALDYLKKDGFTISKIPFTTDGIVDLQALENALTNETILVSVQHINPEIGTIQPIEEIANLTKQHNVLLHSDCVQSFGKLNIQSIANVVDSLTISGHKLYGPKGIGIVYIDPKHRIVPVFPGFVHESGFRGGTLNVPAIAALSEAVEYTTSKMAKDEDQFKEYREAFLSKIKRYPEFFITYQAKMPDKQLPQIIGLCVRQMEGQLMMLELNRQGFAISTGSACKVGQLTSSKVMIALQADLQDAKEFIRISFGESTTLESVHALADQMIQIQQERHMTKARLQHL